VVTSTQTWTGRVLIAGTAQAEALVSQQPLSFWGGYDPATGEVIDRRHDLSGQIARGRVLVFPRGRGSSTASAILLEAIRLGTAPAAIINAQVEPVLTIGSVIAEEIFGHAIPMLTLEDAANRIRTGDQVTIDGDTITVVRTEP